MYEINPVLPSEMMLSIEEEKDKLRRRCFDMVPELKPDQLFYVLLEDAIFVVANPVVGIRGGVPLPNIFLEPVRFIQDETQTPNTWTDSGRFITLHESYALVPFYPPVLRVIYPELIIRMNTEGGVTGNGDDFKRISQIRIDENEREMTSKALDYIWSRDG